MKYLINQRVILNGKEICTVIDAPKGCRQNSDTEVWVMSPTKGFPCWYDVSKVQPLPNGQR